MARRGLGKGLRAYFPDYQEENSSLNHENESGMEAGSENGRGEKNETTRQEAEHAVDRKAKLEEMDMVLPGSVRKAKTSEKKQEAGSGKKREASRRAEAEKASRGRKAEKGEEKDIKKPGKENGKRSAGSFGKSGGEHSAQRASEKSGEHGTETGSVAVENGAQESVGEKEQLLNINQIEPNQEQPRKYFNEEQLSELAESVKNYGILQPLLVQKRGEFYEIIAGERRWRAAKLAGLKEVPVLVRDYTKQQTVEIALIENVQRADLNPIEEAKAYQMLVQEFGLKQEEVAERVSKNRATITNSMRLLKLDERVQKLLIENRLSGGHARALLALEDKEQQWALAEKVVGNQLSVREVERLVKMMTAPKKEKKKETKERDLSFIYRDLEEKLKSIMGTKVTINKKDKNKGRIEIEYYSPAELERIVELLQSIQG